MDFLSYEVLEQLLGKAVTSEFFKTLALFTAAAWVHGSKVKKEIKEQMSGLNAQVAKLVQVLSDDLKAQKEITLALTGRVNKIEKHLNIDEKD